MDVRAARHTEIPRRHRLSTGARLISWRVPRSPVLAVQVAWPVGVVCESPEHAGYANLCAELLMRGSTERDADTWARAMGDACGKVNVKAGWHGVSLHAELPSLFADDGLGLLFEAIRSPRFSGDDVELCRSLALADLRARRDNPAALCRDLFQHALWLRHPYRRAVLGTAASLATATAERVRGFWDREFSGRAPVWTVVGDVDDRRFIERCESWSATGPGRDDEPPREPAPSAPRCVHIEKPFQQMHIIMGFPGLPISDPDRHALEVLTAVLAGAGGYLFLELRDRRSLCYQVDVTSVEGRHPGYFLATFTAAADRAGELMDIAGGIFEALPEAEIPAEVLARARSQLIGSHLVGQQRCLARAAALSAMELYGPGFEEAYCYPERIQAVSAGDVRRVAARVLQPSARVIAMVGPRAPGLPATTHDVAMADTELILCGRS